MTSASQPLVSVIMPVYNAAEYLAAAIEGVLNQTYNRLELIAFDDGSSDDSWEILQHYADKDPRVHIFQHEHFGACRTRNAAIDKARGEFLANNDADDVSEPDRIAKQIAYMQTHPECVALSGKVIWVDPDGDPVHSPKVRLPHDRIEAVLLTGIGSVLQHSCVMYRERQVRTVGGYSEDLFHGSEDVDLYLRLVEAGGRLANLPDHLLTVRLHTGSASMNVAHEEDLGARQVVVERAIQRRAATVPTSTPTVVKIPSKDNVSLMWFRMACRNGYWTTARKHAWYVLRDGRPRFKSALQLIRVSVVLAMNSLRRRYRSRVKRIRGALSGT